VLADLVLQFGDVGVPALELAAVGQREPQGFGGCGSDAGLPEIKRTQARERA